MNRAKRGVIQFCCVLENIKSINSIGDYFLAHLEASRLKNFITWVFSNWQGFRSSLFWFPTIFFRTSFLTLNKMLMTLLDPPYFLYNWQKNIQVYYIRKFKKKKFFFKYYKTLNSTFSHILSVYLLLVSL